MPPLGRKSANTNRLSGQAQAATNLHVGSQQVSLTGWSNTEIQNGATLMSLFQGAGLSKAGAAGFVGNWYQESSLCPTAAGGYLGQWGGSRLTALQSFANQNGKPITDMRIQVLFAMHELITSYPSLLKMLQFTNDPKAAAIAISTQYERPGVPDLANRIQRAYQAFGVKEWGVQGLAPGDAPFQTPAGGGGTFGSVLDLLNSPVDQIGGWLAQIGVNLAKDLVVGAFDVVVVPFWHWNQRAVAAYSEAMFGSQSDKTVTGSDQQWEMIVWNATFWGLGYWLFFVDPDVKGAKGLLKPGPVRKSRIARHARFAQSVPARTKLIKPKEVAQRTAKKPKPVVSFAPIIRTDTMRTHRPERVRVTGNGRGSETGIRREGSFAAPKGNPPDKAHHAENGKPDEKHRTGHRSLQDSPGVTRGTSGPGSKGRNQS